MLSPFSEIAALHKWSKGPTNFTATFIWIDPAAKVAGSYEVKIETGETEASWLILHHKPSFHRPLRPGVWKLLLMYNWETIAETRFIVLPLVYYNGKQVTNDQVKFLHDGPAQGYVDHNFTAIETLLGLKDEQATLARVASVNSRRFGKDLLQWLERLVSEFWTIQDMCIIDNAGLPCRTAQLDSCHTIQWSSRFPDPKADILYN